MNQQDLDRTLALAGLFQAATLVEKIAKTAQVPEHELAVCINSIFVTNPDSVKDVYGGSAGNVTAGLRALRDVLQRNHDAVKADAIRYSLTLIHLERKLRGNPGMMNTIAERIDRASDQARHFSPTHENVLASLASIYLDTISTFKTRIQVMGDIRHLQNQACADKIRAALLAGMRSAILWRQVGGRRWHLVFGRNKMLAAIDQLLKGH